MAVIGSPGHSKLDFFPSAEEAPQNSENTSGNTYFRKAKGFSRILVPDTGTTERI